MFTPTTITVADCWNAIKAGNPIHIRLQFSGQGITLTDEDIDLSEGVVVTDVLNGDTDLTFGTATMKQLTTRIFISDKTKDLVWTGQFALRYGIEVNGSTKWSTVDYFTGQKPENITTEKVVDFIAYDNMQLFDKLADGFVETLTFPCTLAWMLQQLCLFVGLKNGSSPAIVLPDPSDCPILLRQYSEFPMDASGHTCRELLSLMAEAMGRYATIRGGVLRLVWYEDHTSDITINESEQFNISHADIYHGMIWNDFDQLPLAQQESMTWDEAGGEYTDTYGVSCVRVRQTNLGFDIDYPQNTPASTENVYMIVDNPFLKITDVIADRQAYVKPLYDQLDAFKCRLPMKLESVGNWCVQTGDIITVITGTETIAMPVRYKQLIWRGSVTDYYEVTGNKIREAITSDNAEKILNNNLIKLFVEDNYYKVRSGITIEPTGVTISGNKFIKIESGSSFVVQSGGSVDIHATGTFELSGGTGSILLDSSGIDITGNKRVRISADANSKWIYDDRGLSLYNSARNANMMQFGGSFDLHSINTEAGVYAYSPNGDTTHGRLALAATDLVNHYYALLIVEYDYSTGVVFRPLENVGAHLGSSTCNFKKTFTQTIYGSNTGHTLEIHAGNEETRMIEIEDVASKDFSIAGWIKNGNTWSARNIKYYGEIVSISSRNEKHNIKQIGSVSDVIDRLAPVEFVYNNDKRNKKHFGLIYEDTVDLLPEICQETQDKNGGKQKGINYVELVPLLLKEIQDLRKRVSELEEVKG